MAPPPLGRNLAFCLRQLRKAEAQNTKMLGLLRGVREELALRAEDGTVPKEDYERLLRKYDRVKTKVYCHC